MGVVIVEVGITEVMLAIELFGTGTLGGYAVHNFGYYHEEEGPN